MHRKSKPKKSDIPKVLPGAEILGEALMSADGTIVSIHGLGGPMTALMARKDGVQIILPSATIVNANRHEKYVAWDGEHYVFSPTLQSITADSSLMLIGRIKRIATMVAPKSSMDSEDAMKMVDDLELKDNNRKSPSSSRFPASLCSPSAAAKMESFMNARGLNQTEFANRANTTDKTIRKFRQTGKIKRSILIDIAKAMGTTREDLLSN